MKSNSNILSTSYSSCISVLWMSFLLIAALQISYKLFEITLWVISDQIWQPAQENQHRNTENSCSLCAKCRVCFSVLAINTMRTDDERIQKQVAHIIHKLMRCDFSLRRSRYESSAAGFLSNADRKCARVLEVISGVMTSTAASHRIYSRLLVSAQWEEGIWTGIWWLFFIYRRTASEYRDVI